VKVKEFIELLSKLDPEADISAPTLDAVNTIGANDYGQPYVVCSDGEPDADGAFPLADANSKTVIIF
jgi:hypothetical protein